MTDEELKLIVGKLTDIQVKAAEKQPAPKSSRLEIATFIVSVIAIPIILAAWAYIKLDIDSTVQKAVSDAKDSYVPQPAYNNDKSVIWKTLGDYGLRLDSDDVKIGVLQNSVGKQFSMLETTNAADP